MAANSGTFMQNIIYIDIAKNVEIRCDASHSELKRPLSNEKTIKKSYKINKRLIKWEIMTEFATLRRKTYSYLTDEKSEQKKQRVPKDVSSNK